MAKKIITDADKLPFEDVSCEPRSSEFCEIRYRKYYPSSTEIFNIKVPKEDVPGEDTLAKELNLLEIMESSDGALYGSGEVEQYHSEEPSGKYMRRGVK